MTPSERVLPMPKLHVNCDEGSILGAWAPKNCCIAITCALPAVLPLAAPVSIIIPYHRFFSHRPVVFGIFPVAACYVAALPRLLISSPSGASEECKKKVSGAGPGGV